jgi:MscS family membrane protein
MNYFQNFNYDRFLELIIIILGTIVAAKIVIVILVFVTRYFTHRTKTEIDDKFIEVFRGPVFYTIVFSGMYYAFNVLLLKDVTHKFTLPIFQTILLITWTIFLTRFYKIGLNYFLTIDRLKFITEQTVPLFLNMGVLLIWLGSLSGSFIVWDIDMTAWFASAGVAGIAIGFAAKDTLANVISGVFILTDAPFKVGDFILLDTGDRGKVTHIGLRTTRIKTMDDMEITIPNSIISNATLTNESGGETDKNFRVKIPFGVAYGSDIDHVEKIVMDLARKNSRILKNPTPRVRFRLFGASSLDFELLVWVNDSVKRGIVVHELNHAIYKSFFQHNIEIPYSKHDLYIKEFPRK